jgi:hypothetical protein
VPQQTDDGSARHLTGHSAVWGARLHEWLCMAESHRNVA